MERNYLAWHTKTEEALAADVQQADDKAAAEAEAQRNRSVDVWGTEFHLLMSAEWGSDGCLKTLQGLYMVSAISLVDLFCC